MAKWERLKVERIDRGEPDVVVLRLSGVLDGTPDGQAFLEQVQQIAKVPPANVVLNLGGLGHIGSAGVGLLAACHNAVKSRRGRLCLTGITQRVEVLFKVAYLFDVIASAETEDAAVDVVLGRVHHPQMGLVTGEPDGLSTGSQTAH